ncbi:MAG: outer membrane protein assembly factor BamE domain-containing protein [Nitrospiraceae bacterium]
MKAHKAIWMTATLILSLSLLGGCGFHRGNMGDAFKDEDVAALKKGVTTRAQVAALLGAPERIIEANGHEIFQYYRYDVKSGLVLFFSRTNVKGDDLYVMFNKDGVVDEIVFGKRTDRLKFQFWPFGD